MAVTPNDILEKRFERAFRGYDEDQVDEFLDAVKEELENRIEENKVLCNQIVGFEEEIQNLKIKLSEKPETVEAGDKSDEIIGSARETADKYIAEAKQTAENIIIAANKKAEEALDKASTKIKAMYTKAVAAQKSETVQPDSEEAVNSVIEGAKQQAFKMINDAKGEAESIRSKAAEYADRIMLETDKKSKAVYEQKIAEVRDEVEKLKSQYQKEAVESVLASAKEKADDIIRQADEKANQTKNVMNIQIANAQKRLEDIHSAVEKYKTKLDVFVQSQSGMLKGFNVDNDTDTESDIPSGTEEGRAGTNEQVQSSETEQPDTTGQIFTRIPVQEAPAAEPEEDLPVEKLVTMASKENDVESEAKKIINDETMAFSDEERKELEDLLDELL